MKCLLGSTSIYDLFRDENLFCVCGIYPRPNLETIKRTYADTVPTIVSSDLSRSPANRSIRSWEQVMCFFAGPSSTTSRLLPSMPAGKDGMPGYDPSGRKEDLTRPTPPRERTAYFR